MKSRVDENSGGVYDDGIDGWMCPWESRSIAVLGADKCHRDKCGGTMTGLSNLSLSNMYLALKELKPVAVDISHHNCHPLLTEGF